MNFKEFCYSEKNISLLGETEISEGLKYHLDNNISLYENVYRIYSDAWIALIEEARDLYDRDLLALNDEDAELIGTDVGEVVLIEGREIYLDAPLPLEEDLMLEEKSKGKKASFEFTI